MALSLQQQAKRRAERTRRRLKAVANGRLRLSVFRSDKNISAQVIDDAQGVTLAAASSIEADVLLHVRDVSHVDSEAQAEDVGEKFPEQARQMHYGETDARPIYGKASPDDVESLVDEGIDIMPLPDLPEDLN